MPVHEHMQSTKQITGNSYQFLRTSEKERVCSMEMGSLNSWSFALEQVTQPVWSLKVKIRVDAEMSVR